MKKYAANILSMIRMLLAVVLFWFNEVTALFLELFVIAGFTDLIDGPIARKTGSVSSTGAKLDTTGDIIMYLSVAKIIILQEKVKFIYITVALYAGGAIILSSIIGIVRFGKFFLIHTFSGKALGVSCFALPFGVHYDFMTVLAPLICTILIILAFESIIIQLRCSEPDPNISSIFKIR